ANAWRIGCSNTESITLVVQNGHPCMKEIIIKIASFDKVVHRVYNSSQPRQLKRRMVRFERQAYPSGFCLGLGRFAMDTPDQLRFRGVAIQSYGNAVIVRKLVCCRKEHRCADEIG